MDGVYDSTNPLDHYGLVYLKVLNYTGQGIDREDLMQEALLTLVRVCRKFDTKKGKKFVEYAGCAIDYELRRLVREQAHPVRVHAMALRMRKIDPSSLSSNQRETRAAAIRIRRSRSELLDDSRHQLLSKEVSDCSFLEHDDELTKLDEAIKGLSRKVRIVLTYFYGLNGSQKMSLREISRRFNLKVDVVGFLRNEGLRQLKIVLE